MASLVRTSLLVLLASASAPAAQLTEEYTQVTNNLRGYTNFNVETVRGMAVDGNATFAINTHASTLVTLGAPVAPPAIAEPEMIWPTLNNPVALAIWEGKPLVVGGATRALAEHDPSTGAILRMMDLPAEPGDIVVYEPGDLAFVSSRGENLVVEIDLNTFTERMRYAVDAQRPRFLHLDDTDPQQPLVYVAPMLSGSTTTLGFPNGYVESPTQEAMGGVTRSNLLNPLVGWDQDLFEIRPDLGSSPATGCIRPVGTRAGTLMLAHGRNPGTGEYWMLSIDAKNGDDPEQLTEAQLRGDFAKNQLAIFPGDAFDTTQTCDQTEAVFPESLSPSGAQGKVVDLDDMDPDPLEVAYSSAYSLSFPFTLAFLEENSPAPGQGETQVLQGSAFVASSTGDRIALLDPDGDRIDEIDLPSGSIPRHLLVVDGPGGEPELLYAYCWGTNEVRTYVINQFSGYGGGADPYRRFSLGVDPLHEDLKRGREIWYDAKPTPDARVSCNHCHPSLMSDLLAWKLSDLPVDFKRALTTQSLRSIQDTPDYHWREERSLPDFNVAFPGLLGTDDVLGELDLAHFVEFVFGVQAHANPNQDVRRILNDGLAVAQRLGTSTPSAVQGQDLFEDRPAINGSPVKCIDCHMLPSGTSATSLDDFDSDVASAAILGVPHLRQLTHKNQPLPPAAYGFVNFAWHTGFGTLHDGRGPNVFEFLLAFFGGGENPLPPPNNPPFNHDEISHLTNFVLQFDQGISPAAHAAYLLDMSSPSSVEGDIDSILLAQAAKDWIDVVAFEATGDGVERWLYDPGSDDFASNKGGPPLTLQDFVTKAGAGDSIAFLGLPWGDGRRWAHDPDHDMLADLDEGTLGSDPWDPDTDDDGYSDGYEWHNQINPNPGGGSPAGETDPPAILTGFPILDHTLAGAAKFFLEADEPVTVKVSAQAVAGGTPKVTWVHVPARRHTIVLQRLDADNSYDATFEVFDLAGNPASQAGQATFATADEPTGNATTVHVEIAGLYWDSDVFLPTGKIFTAHVRVVSEDGPALVPSPGHRVVLQVLTRTEGAWIVDQTVAGVEGNDQLHAGYDLHDPKKSPQVQAFDVLPGPFLVPPDTNSNGWTTVTFFLPAPPVLPEIRLNVLAVLREHTSSTPENLVFQRDSVHDWQMSSTKNKYRGIERQY